MDISVKVQRLPRNVNVEWDGESYLFERPASVYDQLPLETLWYACLRSSSAGGAVDTTAEELALAVAQLSDRWRDSREVFDFEHWSPGGVLGFWTQYQIACRLNEQEKKALPPSPK